jgi:type II secretory pathway pseudopilin PulG
MSPASFRPIHSFCKTNPDNTTRDSRSQANAQPQWPNFQPAEQSKPMRVIRFSRFILVVIILLVLLAVTAGIAYSYSVQLQDYNRLQSQFKDLASQNLALQNQVQRLRIQISNPTLTIWNSCSQPCAMSAGGWRVGGVPDTFDYNVSFTSNVPVSVYFLTFSQYVQFANCNGMVSCVTGGYAQYGPTTSLQGSVFKLAEGCSGYVAVFQSTSNGTIYPDVSITYNPAPAPTGTC